MTTANQGQMTTQQQGSQFFWPLVDVKENEREICVHAELPGLRKEDIDINVDRGFITISGQRQQESREEKDQWKRVERSYGSFKRSFRLPEGADVDKISATCEHGVLKVVIPKNMQQTPQQRKITVVRAWVRW